QQRDEQVGDDELDAHPRLGVVVRPHRDVGAEDERRQPEGERVDEQAEDEATHAFIMARTGPDGQESTGGHSSCRRRDPTLEPMPVSLRPEIAALPPYRQGRAASAEAFKLSSNENPRPTHPAILAAIAESNLNRYPDGAATALRARLAERAGVSVGEVHVGAGSVSILQQLIQAAAGAGDEVVYPWRSFEAYPGLVTVSGATSVKVPNLPGGFHDLDGLAAAVTDR